MWQGCPGASELGPSPTGISVEPKKYPIVSLIAELHTLPNPAQVLCLHALGRVGACSGEELSGGAAYFFLNALILVGAMGWGLCGKPNP